MTQKELAIRDQEKKFQQLVDLKMQGEKILTISGPAGVGKTYLASKIIKQFKQPGDNIVCTAIAHQAANQLTSSIRKDKALDFITADTVAAVLHHRPIYQEDGTYHFDYAPKYEYKKGKKVEIDPPIKRANFIVFDECSQVSSHLLEQVLKLKNPNSLLIFLGDICQLPPISGEKHSPTFDFPGVELNIPFRYEGNIQDYSFLIRNEILKGLNNKPFDFNVWKSFIEKTNLKDVSFYDNPKTFLYDCLTDMGEHSDIYDIKYVSYRKRTYKKTSTWLRNKINPHDFDYEKGDIIISKTNYYDSVNMELLLNNMQTAKITGKKTLSAYIVWIKYDEDTTVFLDIIKDYKISKTKLKGNIARKYKLFSSMIELEQIKYIAVDVLTDDDEIKFLPIQFLDNKRISEILNYISEDNYYPLDEYYNKWVPYNRLKKFICEIEYAYGINTHVAQGSTFKKSYVSADDIFSVKLITKLQKLQAYYVAITRATDEIKIYYKNKKYDS